MIKMSVSIAYATKEKQWVKEMNVPRGTSVEELIDQSNFLQEIDALKGQSIENLAVGVFSQTVAHDTLLEEGDRVEIYRKLTADPKEVRRQLALIGKTMGGKS